MKLDILAFGAHPDDVELGCGATIAKEVSRKKKVGIIDLTRGELGTRGSATIRDREAKNSSDVLGIAVRENLKFEDCFFTNNRENQLEIIKIIRKYSPEIVLCNAIDDRHIDHPKASKLVSDACFLSGLLKIKTKLKGKPQKHHRPRNVYHYIQWKDINPDFVVDVSGFMDKKIEATMCYSSQFFDPKNKEKQTPITSKNFMESITYRAQNLGRLINVDYAEGFTTERYIGVESLSDLV